MDLREFMGLPNTGIFLVESLDIELPQKRRKTGKPSGYPQSRFLAPPLPEFLCQLCSEVVKRPVECSQCGTLFCYQCLFPESVLVRRSSEAPCSGCHANTSQREVSRVLKRMIGDLKLRCKYKGCAFIDSLELIKTHEKHCDLRQVQCINVYRCKQQGSLKDFLKVHQRSRFPRYLNLNIGHFRYACSQKCKNVIEFERMLLNDRQNALREYKKLLLQIKTFIN